MCWNCAEPLSPNGRIGFRDPCPSCGKDLHACRNCEFYLVGANHDCREEQADPVSDKERGNFCEWFRPAPGRRAAAKAAGKPSAASEFDKLFGGS